MKKFLVTCLVLSFTFIAYSNSFCSGGYSESLSRVQELIEAVRENPLQACKELGVEVDELINEHPFVEKILSTPLPAMSHNESLTKSSRAQCARLIEDKQIDYSALDEEYLLASIESEGYRPYLSKNSLAVVMFRNYIEFANVIEELVKQVLESDLKKLQEGKFSDLSILDDEINEYGMELYSGQLDYEKQIFNSYVLLIQFASKRDALVAKGLKRLLNLTRKKPVRMFEAGGLANEADKALNGLKKISNLTLGPLAWHEDLAAISQNSAIHSREPGSFIQDISINTELYDYNASSAAQVQLQVQVPQAENILREIENVFFSILSLAFKGNHGKLLSTLFSTEFKDIGIHCQASRQKENGFSDYQLFITLASPQQMNNREIIGVLDFDSNNEQDYLLNLAEDKYLALIKDHNDDIVKASITDSLAGYQISVDRHVQNPFYFNDILIFNNKNRLLSKRTTFNNRLNDIKIFSERYYD